MKKSLLLIAFLPLAVIAQKTPIKPATKKVKPMIKAGALKTKLDTLSYALGANFAPNLQSIGIDTLNYTAFLDAVKDVLRKKNLRLPETAIASSLNAKLAEVTAKEIETQKIEGAKFLGENKKRPSVVETASGLQYEIMVTGTGEKPKAIDTVICHYKLTLLNGKEIQSSYATNEPLRYPLNQLIAGWIEALQLMPKGSKWKLFVPSKLAYQDRGSRDEQGNMMIPGGATLIFEMELLDFKPTL